MKKRYMKPTMEVYPLWEDPRLLAGSYHKKLGAREAGWWDEAEEEEDVQW